MKRIMSMIKIAARWQRLTAVVLAAVFVTAAAVTGTMAWADMSQHKSNIVEGGGEPRLSAAALQKYERDAQGNDTTAAVPGTEFGLYLAHSDGTATLIDRYITGADGKIQVSDLEAGSYYWQETRPAPGFLPESENGQPKKYEFTLPAADENPVLVTAYNTRREGMLALTKTVKNSDNSALSAAQSDMLFEFTVRLTGMADGPVSVHIDGVERQMTVSGEMLKILLKSGQTAELRSLPAGLRYEITERQVAGYTTTSENHAGNVPPNGITAAFINTFESGGDDDDGSLIVTKQTTGDGADIDKEFTFTAIIGDTTETFTLSHGESKIFDNIPLGTEYKITENDYTNEHYTATRREYSGRVTQGKNAVILPFVNHYDENPDGKTGDLDISKTISGSDADTTKEFTFTVTFSGEGAPLSPQTFTLKHGQVKSFTGLPHGVTYTVTEAAVSGYSPEFTSVSGTVAGDVKVTAGFINHADTDDGDDEYKITVTKRVLGDIPDKDIAKLFHFTLTINGTVHEFDLRAGEVSEAFTVRPGDEYLLLERDYTGDGYVQSGVINGAGTAGDSDIEILQTNTYVGPQYVDISGVKRWNLTGAPADTTLPGSVTILLKNGGVTVAVYITTAEKGWQYEFKNLPATDALGADIHYTVEEVRMPGWRPVVSGSDVENIYQSPVIDEQISVEKSVIGTPPAGAEFTFVLTAVGSAPMPPSREISINGAGNAAFDSIIYDTPGVYVYTITEKSGEVLGWSYDESVYTLTVTVSNGTDGRLVAEKSLTKNGAPAEKAQFINRYDDVGETINIRVTKAWRGDDENRPGSITVQLYRDGTPHGTPVTLSVANEWTRVFTGLDKNAVWTVDEVNIPAGYSKSISGDSVNGFVITNTKTEPDDDEKTSIRVTKVWKGEGENHPASVVVQLYKDGSAHGGPVTLSAGNGWTYTWSGLEKNAAWTADEVNIPTGYSRAITGDAANGFVITNTKQPPVSDEHIIISGRKTWYHRYNIEEMRPDSITLLVKADGEIILQQLITEAEHWSWSFRLPKYANDGSEIVYTVDEARFYDYAKLVDGHSLINVYYPGMNTDIPDPDIPLDWLEMDDPNGGGGSGGTAKTGDENRTALWIIIMTVSGAAMIGILLPWRRRWDGTGYVPKY